MAEEIVFCFNRSYNSGYSEMDFTMANKALPTVDFPVSFCPATTVRPLNSMSAFLIFPKFSI